MLSQVGCTTGVGLTAELGKLMAERGDRKQLIQKEEQQGRVNGIAVASKEGREGGAWEHNDLSSYHALKPQ